MKTAAGDCNHTNNKIDASKALDENHQSLLEDEMINLHNSDGKTCVQITNAGRDEILRYLK